MGASASKKQIKVLEQPNAHYDKCFAELPSMEGKVVAVTGSTTGTGFATALTVAKKGGRVLLLNRPSDRVTAAVDAIRAAAPAALVTVIDCDLLDLDSVRAAATKISASCPDGLDCLVNNAGIMAFPDQAGKDGYDVQMTTNHLSHFLLTKELFPLLEKRAAATGDARVVNMTSVARNGSPLDRRYLGKNGGNLGGDPKSWGEFTDMILYRPMWERYHQSKLANATFTYALDERLAAAHSNVKALLAHPGIAATNLHATTALTSGQSQFFMEVFHGMVGFSRDDGALPLIRCVCDAAVPSGTFMGPYWTAKGKPVVIAAERRLKDKRFTAMLWEESEKAVGEFTIPSA